MSDNIRKRINRTVVFFAVSFLLLSAAVAVLIFLYMDRNHVRITEQNRQYLEGVAAQSVRYMEEVFDNSNKSIEMVSRLYELQLDSSEFDYRLLNEMTEPTPFDAIRFVGADGRSWAGDGSTVDCIDREYYKEGMKGNSGVCYIELSRFFNEPILLFYTPLYYQNEVIGVVNGVINMSRLSEPLKNVFFGIDADSCLVLRDGTIIAASWERNGGVDRMEAERLKESVSATDWEQALEALEEGRPLSIRYSGNAGVGIAYIAPLAGGEFALVQTFPAAVSNVLMARVNREAFQLEVALIVVFACYLGILVTYYIRRNRKLAREKRDLGQIVDSVKLLYRRFVVFELDKDSYEYLREGDISALGLPAQGSFSDWVETFRRRHEEDPRYWGEMDSMTAEYLRETLTKKNWYGHREYPTPDGRWERLSLIKLDMERDRTSGSWERWKISRR